MKLIWTPWRIERVDSVARASIGARPTITGESQRRTVGWTHRTLAVAIAIAFFFGLFAASAVRAGLLPVHAIVVALGAADTSPAPTVEPPRGVRWMEPAARPTSSPSLAKSLFAQLAPTKLGVIPVTVRW
jgi:hypothetical protein